MVWVWPIQLAIPHFSVVWYVSHVWRMLGFGTSTRYKFWNGNNTTEPKAAVCRFNYSTKSPQPAEVLVVLYSSCATWGWSRACTPVWEKDLRYLRCGAGGHAGSFSLTQVPVDLQAFPLLVLQQVVLYVGVELHGGSRVHEALAVHAVLVHQHHCEVRGGDVQSLPDQNTQLTSW